jgi:uncharacterized membrane protein
MSTVEDVSLVAATVATGLSAGVFYTFQVSIVRALARVDDTSYVTIFQSINRTIVNPWFVSVFIGGPVLAAAALAAHWDVDEPVTWWLAAGVVLQIASVAITGAGNIPLNEQLDRLGVVSGEAATSARSDFEAPWNRLHLIRTVASVAGFVAVGIAAVVAARG